MNFDIRNIIDELPDNWDTCKLSELAEINSKNITKNNCPESINYIDISSISDEKITNLKHIHYSQAPSRAKRIVSNNDIIISTVRPNLRQYAVLENIPINTVASTGFCVISSKKENYVWFLYSFLISDVFNEYLIRVADGAAYPSFNPKEIEDAIIPKPPEDIIIKINFLAKNINQKITLNNQINETLEAMAQAIFKSWFIDFEPVKAKIEAKEAGQDVEGILLAAMSAISGKDSKALKTLQTTAPEEYAELKAIAEQFPDSLKESELGMIPKGWEVRSFFNWIEPKRGKSITKKKVIPGNIPVVAGGLEPAYYHNEHNVIGPAITISASGANAGFINLYFENIWSSDSSYISSKETECIFTAYILLKLRQTDIFKMQTGAAQPHIYPKDFERLFFTYPGMSLFSQFEKYICSSFQKIGKNIQQNKTLTELRDTLLPKLLSGEIDVSNVEIDELLENEA